MAEKAGRGGPEAIIHLLPEIERAFADLEGRSRATWVMTKRAKQRKVFHSQVWRCAVTDEFNITEHRLCHLKFICVLLAAAVLAEVLSALPGWRMRTGHEEELEGRPG